MSKNRRSILSSYQEYICDERDIEVYKKSKRLASLVEIPGIIVFYVMLISFYLLMVNISSYPRSFLADTAPLLEFIDTSPAPTSEFVKFGSIFVLSLLVTVSLLRLESKFQRKAHSSELNPQKYRLDILARGISALRDNEYQTAISHLEEFNELDRNQIPNSMTAHIERYLDEISQEQEEEFIEKTYLDFVGTLMEEILADEDRREMQLRVIADRANTDYLKESNAPQEEEEEATPITYYSITRDIFSEYRITSFKPNFWLLYVIAAAIGITAFIFMDKTLGMISVTILLTGLQIYDRRDRGEDSD